jgi:transcriptional repressor NrdR
VAAIEEVGDRIESLLQDRPEKEISTKEVGAAVMSELKKLDQVAYVRFASVYRDFRDVDEFVQEARALRGRKG